MKIVVGALKEKSGCVVLIVVRGSSVVSEASSEGVQPHAPASRSIVVIPTSRLMKTVMGRSMRGVRTALRVNFVLVRQIVA